MVHIPRWKAFLIISTCIAGLFFASPNALSPSIRSYLPEWMKPLSLGLDLQGGSQLLLEVDIKAGLKDQMNALLDSVRVNLRNEKIGYVNLAAHADSVTFNVREPEQVQAVRQSLTKNLPEAVVDVSAEGRVSLKLTDDEIARLSKDMLKQSIEMVRRRIDEFGTTEPNIQQQGSDSILVQLPGVDDPARVRELLGRTAKMTFRFVHPQSDQLLAEGRIPPGFEKLQGDSHRPYYIVSKQVILGGEKLTHASPDFDQFQAPAVKFVFDSAGARKFADITRQNDGRQLAIVLDTQVISAPVINGQIPTGNGIITGNFTVQETTDLAILMRAGALPAPLNVIEERTVGPDLGADSIQAGQSATIYSVLMVAVFMLLAYSFFGVVADIAVIFNIILLIAVLSLTQATLTLPGIAGIALTIGMAVDANVLINERIKEELRNGQKLASSIEAGYSRAMATIVDSNLTTLIGGLFLYVFGSGAIRGFAVTLSIGILVSMFTAISLTRLIVSYWYQWRRPEKLPI